ncbi:MAG: hypothetical protein ACRD0B_12730, partial [Acidimicrobiales bacterium]
GRLLGALSQGSMSSPELRRPFGSELVERKGPADRRAEEGADGWLVEVAELRAGQQPGHRQDRGGRRLLSRNS